MSYLEEIKRQINERNVPKLLQIWQEYTRGDQVDAKELIAIFQAVKDSDFAAPFGEFVELILPLWEKIEDQEDSHAVISLIVDLEVGDSSFLAEITSRVLKEKYGDNPNFHQWLRCIGFRPGEKFAGAIRKCDMLAHLKPGNFVYHTGGWGVGEIIEVSFLREQVGIEFEYLSSKKQMAFAHLFNFLEPLRGDHFLARRFADGDALEEQARKDPVGVIKMVLHDLGPKSGAEFKEELAEWVIPEDDWAKWWNLTRSKLKKDPMIAAPRSASEPFVLRKEQVLPEEQLLKQLESEMTAVEMVRLCYNFARDMPQAFKKEEVKEKLREKMLLLLENRVVPLEELLQIVLFLEQFFGHEIQGRTAKDLLGSLENVEGTLNRFTIVALKKLALQKLKKYRPDSEELFLRLLFSVSQAQLRDFLLKELNKGHLQEPLVEALEKLLENPVSNPEMFLWYFQKILQKHKTPIPYDDKEGRALFLEAFFILYQQTEDHPQYKEFNRQLYQIFTANRYQMVREIIKETSLEYIRELLLLVAKCHSLTDHDKQIMRALTEVVHPALKEEREKGSHDRIDFDVIWTTEEGYKKTQERIKEIGTVEIIKNAKEIETARAHGDLRENSEYKFALEKRSQIQSELKRLSDQLKRARILSVNDISLEEAGVGSVVDVTNSHGSKQTFTILGPFDVDIEKNIFSFQSKLAQEIISLKKGDRFFFRDEEFEVIALRSYLDPSG